MAAEPLTYSRAELTALLFKAGRGAGLPLGHAEDLGRAVGRHGGKAAFAAALRSLSKSWQGVELELNHSQLRIIDARAIQALPHVIEALQAGMSDVVLRNLDEPDLIPCYLAGKHISAVAEGTTWRFTQGDAQPEPTQEAPSQAQMAALETFAAKTYVPASATSRSGAGQGADQD